MNYTKSDLLQDVENFFSDKLNAKDDLQQIYLLSVEFNLEKKFEELAFTGKYLNGLLRVLKTGANLSEVESLEHVKKDLSANMDLLIKQIREIVSDSDESTKSYFEKKYFQLNQQNLIQLNLLIEDLDRVKKYLNFKKRKH